MYKVLIIGASGLVGGNIYSFLSEKTEFCLVGTYKSFKVQGLQYFNPLDISCHDVINQFKPNVIVHTGGWTYVDGCESNHSKSFEENVKSTSVIIQLAKSIGSKLIYISTDYIFDGLNGPYLEADIPNPINMYGKHKLQSEIDIIQSGLTYLIVRVTNIYGKELRLKNFLSRLVDQMSTVENLVLELPFDQFATPVSAEDISRAIFLLVKGNKEGIYHLSSTDFLSRYQFGLLVSRYFPTNKINLIPVKTSELNLAAPRPLIGGLISSKFNNEFPGFSFSNLDSYMKSILKY